VTFWHWYAAALLASVWGIRSQDGDQRLGLFGVSAACVLIALLSQ
jgi:hypothetical protein